VVAVEFEKGVTEAERQTALQMLAGEVLRGDWFHKEEGPFLVSIPLTVAPDSAAMQVHLAKVRQLPAVKRADQLLVADGAFEEASPAPVR
jgi:hypothetical protein